MNDLIIDKLFNCTENQLRDIMIKCGWSHENYLDIEDLIMHIVVHYDIKFSKCCDHRFCKTNIKTLLEIKRIENNIQEVLDG